MHHIFFQEIRKAFLHPIVGKKSEYLHRGLSEPLTKFSSPFLSQVLEILTSFISTFIR